VHSWNAPSIRGGGVSSKAVRSLNPRWTKLILYGINGDTGTRPWKVEVSESGYGVYAAMIHMNKLRDTIEHQRKSSVKVKISRKS
jgi:hypothetical protein